MDLKQLENIVAIETEKSIARAAEKMYLTQSALNQQLLKLEKELGTQLFERRYHEMIPTFAGRLYLSNARKMLHIKDETYRIIRDIGDGATGEISIAYTPERGSLVFSNIYPVFHKEYPGFQFKTFEARVPKAKQLLLKQETALGLVTYSSYHPLEKEFDKVDTGKEYMVLVLPASHPLAKEAGENSAQALPQIDLERLKDDPFILCSHETSLRIMIDHIFEENKIQPKILFESASSLTILRMAANQLGPAFVPQAYADPALPLVYFRTRPAVYWKHCVAFLKNTYITKPEHRLIELIKECEVNSYYPARKLHMQGYVGICGQ